LTQSIEPIVVEKNRKRAFWSLAIVIFFVPVSALLVLLGLQPGRPDMSWAMVLFGLVGLVAFGSSAIRIVHTMRAPWHLELTPAHLELYTATYDLEASWDNIAGIAVVNVDRKPGVVLVFEDPAAVVERARFHGKSGRADAVTDARTMAARMEEGFDLTGYHLAIPGRILELVPEELAELLVKARTGQLWKEEG
jgi:hypothetical protein